MDNAKLKDGTDLDKLAIAVAKHETAHCTKGYGVTHNNCFGIMTWRNGKRFAKRYKTKADSFEDFKSLWKRKYKVFPTRLLANRYSGNDRSNSWLNNVKYFYYQQM